MSVTKTGLSFLSLERDIGVSKSLKVTELKPRQSVMEADWIRGTPLNRQKSRRRLFLQPKYSQKNMWRLGSNWGSYERPSWFWVGLRGEVQDPHLRPQLQMATCQLGSRWRRRGHCQGDWGYRKAMPHACRYKSPSPLPHGSPLQGWPTFWEALHNVKTLPLEINIKFKLQKLYT